MVEPNTLDEVIEILQAFKEGKQLQYLLLNRLNTAGTWKDFNGTGAYLLHHLDELKFRIKK